MIARCVPPALIALTLLTSCRKPAVESYRIPKETAPPSTAAANPHPTGTNAGTAPAPSTAPAAVPAGPASGGTMASTAVATASGADLTWSAPADWKTKPGSAMRKGSYTVTAEGVAGEADLSITAFPGAVGGDLANLNRWRGQLQLAPVSQAEFDTAVQRLQRNGLEIIVADIGGTGAGAQRILGAMVPYGGATWFFKLMGPDAVVTKQKPAFLAFLDTVKPAAAAR